MTTLPKDVLHWIAGYHGTVTSVALREHGISAFQQRRLVQDGTLIRMINGSYRFAGAPSNHHDRYVSACSHASELVICGPSAGLLWNLRRMPRDGLVHVIAPPHSNPTTAPWLKPYRTALLDPRHVVHRLDGIRLTAPPRTAVDLSRHLNGTDLRSIIDQLVHRGTCTPETMRDVALSLDTPGRPWARRFLDVLDKRPAGPPTESHGESRVAEALQARGIRDVRPQRWLDLPNFRRIRLDAAVDRICWGVEVDGYDEHFTEAGATADHDRDLECDAAGWRVSRVTSLALDERFDKTIDRLMAVYTFRCEEYAAIERGRETQAVHRFGELPAQHTVSPLTSPRGGEAGGGGAAGCVGRRGRCATMGP